MARRTLTREDILMDRHEEYPTNEDIEMNVAVLAFRVNGLLKYLEQTVSFVLPETYEIYRGYAPGMYNTSPGDIGDAAHLIGSALDLVDTDNKLGYYLLDDAHQRRNASVLAKFKLRMQHPDYTEGICHLDTRPVGISRVFKP